MKKAQNGKHFSTISNARLTDIYKLAMPLWSSCIMQEARMPSKFIPFFWTFVDKVVSSIYKLDLFTFYPLILILLFLFSRPAAHLGMARRDI